MNTDLPASLAPTGTIRRLGSFPKCTGSRLWQTGQTLIVLSTPHAGQLAALSRPSAVKGGGSAPEKPVWSRSSPSTATGQRLPSRLSWPVHRNWISASEISS